MASNDKKIFFPLDNFGAVPDSLEEINGSCDLRFVIAAPELKKPQNAAGIRRRDFAGMARMITAKNGRAGRRPLYQGLKKQFPRP